MELQQAAVDYLEEHELYDHSIMAYPSLLQVHLVQPYTGFLKSNRTFKKIVYNNTPPAEYIAVDNIEHVTVDSNQLKEQYNQVFRLKKGEAWVEIYKHK